MLGQQRVRQQRRARHCCPWMRCLKPFAAFLLIHAIILLIKYTNIYCSGCYRSADCDKKLLLPQNVQQHMNNETLYISWCVSRASLSHNGTSIEADRCIQRPGHYSCV